MGLHIPQNGCEIQTVKGVKYLVARLDDDKSVQCYLDELKAGKPTLVRYSSRGSLTTRLKREGVFTRQATVVAGQWILFTACEERVFKS